MDAEERFWQGQFGNEYTARSPGNVAANTAFFARALARTDGIRTVIELGAGTGANLRAIRALLPKAELHAVEINPQAADLVSEVACRVDRRSVVGYAPTQTYDLTITKGLLIHIAPAELPAVYAALMACAKRYMLIAEYHNPTPVEVSYRGHARKLWKRDFAGELLDKYENLRIVDYGFAWKRDALAPQDNLLWVLLEKRAWTS